MTNKKKKLPEDNSSKEKKQRQQQQEFSKKFHVKVLNGFILKNNQQAVKCYIEGNPAGVYHVQSKIIMNTVNAFRIDSRVIAADKPFNLIIQNCEAVYSGRLDFKKGEIIAEAQRFF